jgi:sirohydrochlorin ferrochelatase
MTLSLAYLLVFHGSSDRRSQQSLDLLASLVSEQLGGADSQIEIATASLELTPIPLHQAICEFAQKVQVTRLKIVKIYPLFLLAGVHVTQDIPKQVELARKSLGDDIQLELLPHLGTQPELGELLQRQFEGMATSARILLSHGSRLDSGNQGVEKMASQLQAIPAYWSVSPSLREQVLSLANQGQKTIAIVPFFLFARGITEIITQQIQQLQQEDANLKLLLGETLGATRELARVIIEGLN